MANDSEASRNSDVEMALLLCSSIGTFTNDLLTVSNHVPPGGWTPVDAISSTRKFLVQLMLRATRTGTRSRLSKGQGSKSPCGSPKLPFTYTLPHVPTCALAPSGKLLPSTKVSDIDKPWLLSVTEDCHVVELLMMTSHVLNTDSPACE